MFGKCRPFPPVRSAPLQPDYEAPDTLLVSQPEQLRALADGVRTAVIALLRERAFSTQQLAEKLGIPKGTVGHHLKVLESAGLIHVVRTRKVRAMTEKFYGRTARLFLFQTEDPADARAIGTAMLRQAASELERSHEGSGVRPHEGVAREEGPAPPRAAAQAPDGGLPRRGDAGRRAVRARHGACTGVPMSRLRRPTGGLWSHPDFLKLWTGQSISELGSQVSQLAIPWLAAVGLHASPIEFSLLGVLGFLPFILFALPAGVWVDRLRRRPILIVGDASRAVLLALIPILWAVGVLQIWHLLVLQFVIGIFTVFFDVAYQSYLPALDRARASRRRELEAPAHRLGRAGRRAEHVGRPHRRDHRAVRDRRRRRELRRLDRLHAPDAPSREPAARRTRTSRGRRCGRR